MSDKANVVVVGVDGSDDSTAALRWADNYAKATHSKIRLVTSWTWPYTYGAPVTYDGYLPDNDALAVIEKAKTELTVSPTSVESVCREGGAGPVLVAECEHADLLVVGAHGHSAIGGLLLGSVSNYCVHHASCSVVIVR